MRDSVEKRIKSRLKGFVDALKRDESISEKFTCRTVVLDLHPMRYNSKAVLATRKLLNVSQGVFAHFLGVSVKTVRAWEQDRSNPSDMACRFMDEIQRNPDYWRKRLSESILVKEPC